MACMEAVQWGGRESKRKVNGKAAGSGQARCHAWKSLSGGQGLGWDVACTMYGAAKWRAAAGPRIVQGNPSKERSLTRQDGYDGRLPEGAPAGRPG
jgi:hypothetical protein